MTLQRRSRRRSIRKIQQFMLRIEADARQGHSMTHVFFRVQQLDFKQSLKNYSKLNITVAMFKLAFECAAPQAAAASTFSRTLNFV